MTPSIPSKSLRKKLKKSNVYVEDPFGRSYRVPPVKELRDPIERFLPPAGQYYDQSVFEGCADVANKYKECVLGGKAGKECKHTQCAMCGKKHSHRAGCSKVYASIKWWQRHGHHPSKKSQLRPNPGERAHLVVAGVLKDWKKLEDPVIVNMEHPAVEAFYKGKEAPSTLAKLPDGLLSTSSATIAKSSTVRWIDEPDADEANQAVGHEISPGTASERPSERPRELDLLRSQRVGAEILDDLRSTRGEAQISSVSPREDITLFRDVLENPWQPPSYHEGTRRAAVTPLSIRLALNTAQGLAATQKAVVSPGNEIHPDLDPRLKARAPSRYTTLTDQSSPASDVTQGCSGNVESGRMRENKCEDCHEELLKAREEIRAKDRRIRELELSLHEAEGWTDAATYQRGQKRPRA